MLCNRVRTCSCLKPQLSDFGVHGVVQTEHDAAVLLPIAMFGDFHAPARFSPCLWLVFAACLPPCVAEGQRPRN
jgi:hypothetical protein